MAEAFNRRAQQAEDIHREAITMSFSQTSESAGREAGVPSLGLRV